MRHYEEAPRRLLWLAFLWAALAILWMCGACHSFAPFTVRGTLVAVAHDDRYEAPCNIRARVARDCDEMPVCCSYKVTVRDSASGKRTAMWAFWPRSALGLLGIVPLGATATFRVHTAYLSDLQSCSLYGCPQRLEYILESDKDVTP